MSKSNMRYKSRLMIALFLVSFLFLCLVVRIGYLQLVKGVWLKEKALSQQTKDVAVEAKRGTIYDRKGKELALSLTKYTVWAEPSKMISSNKKDLREDYANVLAEVLEEDKNAILDELNSDKRIVRVKRWIDYDKVQELKKHSLRGVWIVKDNKRYYPYGNFASHVIGHVSSENSGMSGIENKYDKDLRGLPGRNIISTDVSGREIPYGNGKYNEPKDGMNIVLTIDEVIQHYAEEAVDKALIVANAKKAHAIVMDPKTGEILSMVSKPDYDPNKPRIPVYPVYQQRMDSGEDQLNVLMDMWRNPMVNDIYEPGSTFKLIVAAAGLEEDVVKAHEKFYDKGYIMVADRMIKDAGYPKSHGEETFAQAIQNSCNPVFVQVGQRLGLDKLYEYIQAFGVTEKTGIDLPGEGKGITYKKKDVGPVELATISFGQGIAMTPMQLITSISSIANDGKLMKPRVVKEFIDSNGDVVERFEPEKVRNVISEDTAKLLRSIMEAEVTQGGGKKAYISGYHVGGKTGTAQKVINGKYAKGKYISSFVGIAPADNPKVVVLVVVDEPNVQSYYGGSVAAPAVKDIIYNTLRYLNVKPVYTEKEKQELIKEETTVPEVRNLTLQEAGKILLNNKLNFTIEPNINVHGDEQIIDMFPKPNTKIPVESNVILYIKGKNDNNKVNVVNVEGKTIKEVSNIFEGLGLKLKAIGNGKAVTQNPAANTQVEPNSIVTVNFE
ncbi:PASTA domain-containing penicillin-binding protein [Tepidibacter hydrothermalis]|uniref:Penicillin-binding transpeptidase domain-containing protein n=1 Tax=Tepidibacter hydrothermalis TaxID=3036126 RepID=A0ABY8E8C6_9FIRM|nr:PASTA domain-containing penicillin-binding protein [Tepidibacter hydrothermalis]WFD09158.1 penicillin-binding transpeptidase domain-containing protein [Tepidibacter hydrothermalis]